MVVKTDFGRKKKSFLKVFLGCCSSLYPKLTDFSKFPLISALRGSKYCQISYRRPKSGFYFYHRPSVSNLT
jgi:hypothetical protein